MNWINFSLTGGMPLTQDSLDFLQQEYLRAFGALAEIAGDKVILNGCIVQGSSVSSGFMGINGELVFFKGGVLDTKVLVNQSIANAVYEDLQSKPLYYTRFAEFSSVGTINWSDFVRLDSLRTLNQKIDSILEGELGIAKPYQGLLSQIPKEHLICDGSVYNIATYPRLAAKLGNRYGGDGTTTFAVPNNRQRFFVAYDSTTAQTPPHAIGLALNYAAIGNTGGENTHKLTATEVAPHYHYIANSLSSSTALSASNYPALRYDQAEGLSYLLRGAATAPSLGRTSTSGNGDGHENRPPYIVVCYIMRAF